MRNLGFDFSGGQARPMVLDLETQYLSHEVSGGWNAVEDFKVAVVVTWDAVNGFRTWQEPDLPGLFRALAEQDPIVTFNGEGFDFKVLSAYGPVQSLYPKSTDLLQILSRLIGFRVKLDSLAQSTLGRSKTASGTQSVLWWRSGDAALRQRVIDYCRADVELTRDIYQFGRDKGYILIDDLKRGEIRKVAVSW